MSFGSGFAEGFGKGMSSEIRKGSNKINSNGKSGRSQVSSSDTAKEYPGVSSIMNQSNSNSGDSGDDYIGGSQG